MIDCCLCSALRKRRTELRIVVDAHDLPRDAETKEAGDRDRDCSQADLPVSLGHAVWDRTSASACTPISVPLSIKQVQ